MKSKTIFNYVTGAVAGVGLTIGSVAFAVNTGHSDGHHTASTMGNTTEQTTQHGMTGKTTQGSTMGKTNMGGMQGQATQGTAQDGTTMQNGTGHGNMTTPATQKQTVLTGCLNAMTENQAVKTEPGLDNTMTGFITKRTILSFSA